MSADGGPDEALRGLRVAESSWPEVEARARGGALGVLPVGAVCKAHGRHLPMNADWLQAEWLAGQLARDTDVLVWPTLGYGHYPAFTDYPGSTSLREATFVAMVVDVLDGVRRAGVTRCLVLNTGVSTIRPLEAAMRRATGFTDLRMANLYSGPRFRAVEAAIQQQPRGGHADEIETSIMLAIAPGTVDMSRAEPWADREIRGRLNRRDPTSPGYAPGGVYGDPTVASAVKGVRLVEAILADVMEALGAMVGGA